MYVRLLAGAFEVILPVVLLLQCVYVIALIVIEIAAFVAYHHILYLTGTLKPVFGAM
jgi:hypothetical protein